MGRRSTCNPVPCLLAYIDSIRTQYNARKMSAASVYDLDRWDRAVRRGSSSTACSLSLHLHPSHCRFEHQNGVFLYDSPIRSLLRSIRDGRLPTELLDLLDATDVRYFEGCLVVEVHDHREGDGSSNGGALNDGSNSSNAAGSAALNGNTGSHLGKRANDGTLLSQAGLSLSNSNSNNSNEHTSSSSLDSSATANQFRFNFVTSFKRFEEARRDIQRKIEQRKAKDAATMAAAAARAQAAVDSQSQAGENGASASGIGLPGEMSSTLHSAVAAAVAAAPEQADIGGDGQQGKAPVYRIVLGPDAETIWTDLLIMREAKKKRWTEREMVEMEAKILVR